MQQIEKVSFPEALEIIAEKFGIAVPSHSVGDDRRAEERKQVLDANERAVVYFRRALSSDQAAPARQVLQNREIAPDFAEKFQLGYAPSWACSGL